MTQEEILRLISNNLKYSAYVYTQLNTIGNWNGDYKIEYLYEKIPDNSLVFMVPRYSSLPTRQTDGLENIVTANKLTVRFLVGVETVNGVKHGKYLAKSYTIYVENSEGVLTLASKNDIVANRMAIFRFIKGDEDSVILINSPIYNSVQLSTLSVTNEALFYTRPVTVDRTTGAKIPLATNTDLLALENRVKTLENRIQYGTEDAEEALANAPLGTIYIKVEEGE